MEKSYRGAIKIGKGESSDTVHFIAEGESIQQVCGMAMFYYKALNPGADAGADRSLLSTDFKEVRIDFGDVKEVFYEVYTEDCSNENPEGFSCKILVNASSKRDVKARFSDIDPT